MKIFFLVLLIVFPFIGMTQTLDIRCDGSVSNMDLGKKEAGVTVSIIQGGQTIASSTTASNGKYSVKAKIDHTKIFEIVFSKSGMVNKKVHIDLKMVNLEDTPAGDLMIGNPLDMDLFATRPGLDFSFLDTQPVAKLNWNHSQGAINNDVNTQKLMADKINKLLKDSEDKAKNNDVAYNEAIKAADKAYNEKNYQAAMTRYEEALKYKPKEKHPNDRIIEIDAILQKQKEENLKFNQDNAAYLNLIKAADNLKNAGDYAKAKEKYNEAIDLKDDEQYPRDQISAINKLIKEKENEEKYKKLIEAADIMYKQKSFKSARDNYAEASKLKPNEQYPKDKLKELEDKIKTEENAAAKKAEYDKLVEEGEQFVKEEKWEEAKGKFEEALKIESASTYVKGQLDVVNKKIAEIKAEKEKAEKIAKLLKEGEMALADKTYDAALGKFKEVLVLDNANAVAKEKIALVEKLIADEAKNKELNDKFNALVKQGDDAVTAKKYQDAITKYTEAIGLKNDAAVNIKIDDAKKALADLENAQKKEADFAKLISEGQTAFTAKNYTTALEKYEAALLIKPEDAPTSQKITEIKKLIGDQQAVADKLKKIEQLIQEGTSLMEGSVMDGPQLDVAKLKFNEVLSLDDKNVIAKTKIAEIDKLLKEQQSLADKETKFKENVAKGDAEATANSWEKAISFYTVAIGIKDDASVRQKIADAQTKLNELNASKKIDADYQKAITDADALKNAQKLQEALAKYEVAKGLKPSESYPQEEIDKINKLLADKASVAEKEAQIKNLLAEGETLFGQKEYQNAKSKFEQVLTIDSGNSKATQRISDINVQLALLADQAQKQQQITQLIQEGQNHFSTGKFEEAKGKFEQVQSLDKENPTAKKYLADIANELAKLKNQADANEKFNAFVTQGNNAFSAQKWQEAITAYNDALKIKDDAFIQQKRDDAQQKLNELIKNQESEAKYTAAITAANALRDGQKYQEAISKYEEAKTFKSGEPYPQQEIDKIKQLLTAADANKKINQLLTEGQTYLTAKDYSNAKSKYQEVLSLENSNETAKTKLAEIASIQNSLASEQAKEAEFNQLKTQGLQAFANQDYNNAMLNFEKALKIKDDSEIKQKINEITALKANQDATNQKIQNLLSKGKSAFDKKSWAEATTAYQEVLIIDSGNSTAKNQLALIQNEIEKTQNDAKNQEEFNKWKALGFAEMQSKDWEKAKHSFETALTYKQDAEVTQKLQEVKNKINDIQKAKQLEQEYSSAMNKAQLAEAANNYSEALNEYTKASSIKPMEQLPKDKIAAMKQLLEKQNATSTIDKKYNDLIQKGDELVSKQDYAGAIQKYNEALTLKPTEQLPVIKAKEAEKLAEEQKKLEQNAQFEKIITAINNKINENDFKKAKEYIATAASLRPTDPRPSTLLAKIEQLEKENAEFLDYMYKASVEENAKNYQQAITWYEKAKIVKPSNPEPAAKIEALRQLMADAMSAADKEKMYSQYFEAGQSKQNIQEYELAIQNYKKALGAKPNDTKAIAKIAEVEAFIAKRDADNKSKQEADIAFNKIVLQADEYFNNKDYQKAVETYRQALSLRPDNAYAKKQLAEAEKLNKQESASLANQQYQKILDVADNHFKDKNYEKALEYYNRALTIKSNDPYPKNRIEEINGILNPIMESSAELQALGEPFDGSILDGEVALKEAEQVRKDSKRTKINQVQNKAIISNIEMTDNKKAELAETINTIYNLYTKIIETGHEKGVDKIEVTSKIHVAQKQKSDLDIANNNYEQFSVSETQELLEQQKIKASQDFDASSKKQQENHLDIDKVRIESEDISRTKSYGKIDENIQIDGQLTNISIKIENNQAESTIDQHAIAKEVDVKRIDSEDKAINRGREKYTEAVENKKEVENVYVAVTERAYTSTEQLKENTKKINEIDHAISNKNTSDVINSHHEAIGVDAEMKGVKLKVVENEVQQEVSRIENVEVIKANANELIESEELKKQNNALKNNDTKVLIEEQDIKKQANNELATIAHKDKVKEVAIVEASTANASSTRSLSDNNERLSTQRELDIKQSENSQREVLESQRLKEKGEQVKETSKVLSTNNTSLMNEKIQTTHDVKKEIDKVGEKGPEKTIVPNSLGEKYPEGVSQEMFQRKDDAGILTAIVTRRIVVTEGRGVEYVRTQTNHAITYSKNGNPITEHVWQKETQDAKLQRHY
jgi:epidermal growth factor receptor substrate 15